MSGCGGNAIQGLLEREVAFEAGAARLLESDTSVQVTVRADLEPSQALDLELVVTGTATAGADFAPLPAALRIAEGSRTTSLVVTLLDDSLVERPETIALSLRGGEDIHVPSAPLVVTIDDDDSVENAVVSIDDAAADEADGTLDFVVRLSGRRPDEVTVAFATADGTALASSDYVSRSGTVTFAPGELAQVVSVDITDDAVAELDETLSVVLSSASGASLGDATGEGVIRADGGNNGPDEPTVVIDDVTIDEDDRAASFTVSLSNPSAQTITVDYATADDTARAPDDYTGANGTLVFEPGLTQQSLTITVIDDARAELAESFFVDLLGATHAEVVDDRGVATIAADTGVGGGDEPLLAVGDASGDETAGTLAFEVSLSNASDLEVSVAFATVSGTATGGGEDYDDASGTLTFAPGELSKTVLVTLQDDTVAEADETFTVALSAPVAASLGDANGVGTISADGGGGPGSDMPGLSIDDVVVNEDAGMATLTVRLTSASSFTVTVDFATADASALAGDDFVARSGTLTFTPGQVTRPVVVDIVDDVLSENDEGFTVALSNADQATIVDGSGQITIRGDDSTPGGGDLPGLSVDDVSVAENGGTVTFTVELSNASARSVSVNFATGGGTASADVDYGSVSGSLSFAPGELSQLVVVNILDDTLSEPDETFALTLDTPQNANITQGSGTATIVGDDTGSGGGDTPEINVSDAFGGEGTGRVRFTLTLTNASALPVTVRYDTSDGSATAGSDFTGVTAGSATFSAGATTLDVDVTVTDDLQGEPAENFTVTFSAPVNATLGGTLATGTIAANDMPSASIADVEVDEDGTPLSFTVLLSNPSALQVTVNYATADNSATAPADYGARSGTLTFVANDVSESFDVSVVDDALSEPDEFVTINLSAAVNATLGDGQALGKIRGDTPGSGDTPFLSIDDVSSSESGQLSFTVSLSNASALPVTVLASTTADTATSGDDYAALSSQLVTFAANETTQTVVVSLVNDLLGEPAETLFLDLASPTNAAISDSRGVGTIAVSDTPSITIDDVGGSEGGAATLTVSLSNASTQTVTVAYATAGGAAVSGSDFTPKSGTLSFAPGDIAEPITVSLLDDIRGEAAEAFVVNLSSATDATLGDAQGQVTIAANDAPGILVGDVAVAEGVGTFNFVVSLTNPSDLDVAVDFATSDGLAIAPDDFGEVSGTLVIGAGDLSENIPVAVVDDDWGELDEELFLDLSAPDNATLSDAQGEATIGANDTPSLTIDDVSLAESGGAISFTVTLSNRSAIGVSVTAATANNTALAPGDYTAITQVLSFLPGDLTETLPVTLVDNGTPEANETFFVNLSAPSNATVADNQGVGTINNDDAHPTVTFSSASQSAAENVGTASVQIVLSGASDLAVTVPYSVGGGSTAGNPADYTFDAGSPVSPVVFSPGTTSQTLTLDLVSDGLPEVDETVVLNLGAPTNGTLGTPSTHTVTILDNDTAFVLTGAETIDADHDGLIDHFKLTFNKTVNDSTFPGYAANAVGGAQAAWLVAGLADVRLAHGTAAPMADTVNDAVLYVTFTENSGFGTGATPDVTTTATPGLQSSSGSNLSQVTSETVSESDRAKPVLTRATTDVGLSLLNVFFSEPVQVSGACPGATVPASALIYHDDSVSDVGALVAGSDNNGCDAKLIVAPSSGTFTAADLFVDAVEPDVAQIRDVAGNFAYASATTITGIIHPYVLNVVSTGPLSVRVTFSEAMSAAQASAPANYAYTSTTCVESPTLSGGAAVDGATYDFTTSAQNNCIYRLEVTGDVRDFDESAAMVAPKFGTFQGNEVLRVVSAQARSLRTVLVTLNKNVKASGSGGAANVSYYALSAALGAVSGAVRYDTVTGSAADKNKILITHASDQGASFYAVILSTALRNEADTENLAPEPLDRATFLGLRGNVTSIDQGAMFTDPFVDGTTFSFVFEHQGKIYAGTNDNNNAVFRFDPDGGNPVVVRFRIASASAGSPFASFGNSIARPTVQVTSSGGTTRYYFPPGTDLGLYAPGVLLLASGCTNATNNEGTAIATTAVNDASDYVEISSTGVTSTTETCVVTLYSNNGPAGFDGIDAFVSAPIATSKYLIFGAHNFGGGGFNELYYSSDNDTVLDTDYCDISAVTIGNTESLQTVYGYGDYLYFGFGSNTARLPVFAHLNLGSGACGALVDKVVANGAQTNKQIKELAYLGASGSPANGASNIGIDSIIVAPDGASVPGLYITNNGGIAATTALPPTGTTQWINVRHDGDGVWTGTTQAIPDIGKLRPGEKGVPVTVRWGAYLFVARNRSDSSGVAEVWRYSLAAGLTGSPPPSDASRWTRVVASTDVGMNANNRDVSMLVVNGDRLYIGFDNTEDGAEVWRTTAGVTAAALDSVADLQKVGASGLGPVGDSAPALAKNKHILSSASAYYNGSSYLYLTVGCLSDLTDNGACDRNAAVGATDFAIRVFRQVD